VYQGALRVCFVPETAQVELQRLLWDNWGASFPPSLLDRGTRGGVTKTAKIELKSG
jgi:hypothetical protein